MNNLVKLLRRLWDTVTGPPLTLRLREEHKRLILHRTRVGSLVAGPIFIFTIFIYNYFYFPHQLFSGMCVGVTAAIAAGLLYFSPRLKLIQNHYQFPLVIILSVIANGAATINLQLTGGGMGFFFFPYFILFIAMAVYFPGSFGWILVVSLVVILGYASSEWWMGRDIHSSRFASNLIYLVDAAALCIVGNRLFYQFFIRDKQNQLALEEANLKLQALDQAKSAFFANVSHELKTPMTLVVTPLESARLKLPKAAPEVVIARETFESVRHNAYRLAGLISDLLDLTKSEIGKARVSPIDIQDSGGFVENICNSVRPLTQEKGLQFEFVVGPPPGYVGTDPAKEG